MRLTIVQYAGDYRETFERFEAGGKATYQAQRYSVDFVASLAQRFEQVAIVCALSEQAYDVVLRNKVRAIGLGLKPGFRSRGLIPVVKGTRPDRLLLTTPMAPLLRWARKSSVRTLTMLADSFQKSGIPAALKHRLLAWELNRPNVEFVGNHGIAACLSLVEIGVRPTKVVPWDWPPSHRPHDHLPRELLVSGQMRLIYVGSVVEAKGVGDLLHAVDALIRSGMRLSLTIIGRDPDGRMEELARRLGLGENVQFAHLVPNEDIPGRMREADAVVIPSRHEYPEGLPLTIYESLAARTPIIASDHPMFRGALVHEESALIFPAGNSDALASAIRRLSGDSKLYSMLSRQSDQAWEALQLPVSWGEMIERWLSHTPVDTDWLQDHCLTSGRYDAQIASRK